MTTLFSPMDIGALQLSHRVVMAPLSRMRASKNGGVPTALNVLYYWQRASQGGLIVSEATDVSPFARGYVGAPGIHTAEQVDGWRAVTDAVHAKGGLIACQLWHTGRVSHSSLQPGGRLPGAPSAIAAPAFVTTANGMEVRAQTPRELDLLEIEAIKDSFVRAARNAMAAGFDAVEVHGANGYLLDQFLQDGTNQRQDAYGASLQNRARLLLDVTDAVADAVGSQRVGVRLSPLGSAYGIFDSGGISTWKYVAEQLGMRSLAYLHLVEPRTVWGRDTYEPRHCLSELTPILKRHFGGAVIASGGYSRDSACAAVASGTCDAVAFGRLFISNPDLPMRLRLDAPLNKYELSTFYGGGAAGYTDYPALEPSGPKAFHSVSNPLQFQKDTQ